MVWENKNKHLFHNNVNITLLNGTFKYDEDGKFYITLFTTIKKNPTLALLEKYLKDSLQYFSK